jgi:copper transport protein
VLVSAAVLAAAVLSSLPPPSKALASVGRASAHVGPGTIDETVKTNGYQVGVKVTPNRAAVPNDFEVAVTKNGKPVSNAAVTATFAMLDMEMSNQEFELPETSPGRYTRASTPALVMVGHWGLTFHVTPRGSQPFDVILVDKAAG